MKIQVFSSCAQDTGSWVRTCNIVEALGRHATVELVWALPRCLPFRLDIVLSFPWYLLRALTSRADVLLASKPFPNTMLPLLLARWLRGKKVVVDVDDLDHGYVTGLPARIIAALQRPFPRHFDLVTVHHEKLGAFVREGLHVPEERIYRLAQGVNLERFRSSGSAPADRSTLFFMGHLDVASSLESLLRAVALVQAVRSAPLTVVGGGRLKHRFRAEAAARGVEVRFTGRLTVDRTACELDRAGVCLVYYDETEANACRCSMKIREYLAMGKRVVSNDFGDLREFQRFTYSSSSRIEDFACAIQAALDGGDGREEVGARYVKDHYDWDSIGARFFARLAVLSGSAPE